MKTWLVRIAFAPKSIQKHVDNVWLLGGEINRDLNTRSFFEKLPVDGLLPDAIDAEGVPLIPAGSEEEQRSFDSTCRTLHRFLSLPAEKLEYFRNFLLFWRIYNGYLCAH